MSLYGRYVPNSDGWDDGFNEMRDTGEDSGAYLAMVAEYDPEDWTYRYEDDELLSTERVIADLIDGTCDAETILDVWRDAWGALSDRQVERFLSRDEVRALCTYPLWLVTDAVRRERLLHRALQWITLIVDELEEELPGRATSAAGNLTARPSTRRTLNVTPRP